MKRTLLILTAALAAGWLVLSPAAAQCGSCGGCSKGKKEQPTDSGEKKPDKKG